VGEPSKETVAVLNWVWLIACGVMVVMSVVGEFLPGVKLAGRLGLLIPIAGGIFRGYLDGLAPILDRRRARRAVGSEP
jgi:hypothetical protein